LQLRPSQNISAPQCTANKEDPYARGYRINCCDGLQMCLGIHGYGWSYRCYPACTVSCTDEGERTQETGSYVACCEGLQECLGDWQMNGFFSTRCYRQCDMGTYHPHFDTTPDYLNISARARGIRGNGGNISDNFYLVIGDSGGCDGGCSGCCGWQQQVASKMNAYVKQRKQRNPNSTLLFVLLVGDNFYWMGCSPGRFDATWRSVYGALAEYPWFAVFGNHDYGNDDPKCLCPFFHERVRCGPNSTGTPGCGGQESYSSEDQSYACNQLDSEKGGVDGEARKNFHSPDFMYFYTIPELDFELISMDYNWYDRNGLGGNGFGSTGAAKDTAKACGGAKRAYDSLASIRNASTAMMRARAKKAESTNVAIIGHYPDWFQDNINLRKQFLSGMSEDQAATKRVLNFYGHTHIQRCDKKAEDGYSGCTDVMTGGGGGCCGDTPAGFVSVTWGEDGKQTIECLQDSDCTIPHWSLLQHNVSTAVDVQNDVCEKTQDDPRCPRYTGPLTS